MRLVTLLGSKDAVVIDVHLIEMSKEGLFELLLRHGLEPGKAMLEEPQRVPADARRRIAPRRRADKEQFAAEHARFAPRNEAVMVQIEAFKELIRAFANLVAGEARFLLGTLGVLSGWLGSAEGCDERSSEDEQLHREATVPELNRLGFVPIAESLSSQSLQHWA